MYGTEQLARMIVRKHDNSTAIMRSVVANSPEPLRTMVYYALGEEIAHTIDGTDLYSEIVDHIEQMLQ